MKKIAIYGTGRVAEYFMNNYDLKVKSCRCS